LPDWRGLLDETKSAGSTYDITRRKYLKKLYELTGRNAIVYYSAWLQKKDLIRQGLSGFDINDEDKSGFMSAINKCDRSKGLDLILHTPGGEIGATESIVDYLRTMFNNNIRAIIPQIAMSAGTMIACACNEIIMGSHSNLGPIDPQINGIPTHGIIEEFQRAATEIQKNAAFIPLWQPIIAKYNPTLIGECEKAIVMAEEIVSEWLKTGMFAKDSRKSSKVDKIISELGSHSQTKTHSRHISMAKAKAMGLKVITLEDNQELQEAVLSVHHACILTMESTGAIKIIENHEGKAYIKQAQLVKVQ
jgi:ATP-dependent protease ClpP protease subunit